MSHTGSPLLVSWRHALLASLGLAAGCGGDVEADSGDNAPSGGTTSSTGGGSSTGGSGTGGDGTVVQPSGITHRASPSTCDPFEPRAERQLPTGWDAGAPSIECEFDADCTERSNGYCVARTDDFGDPYARCSYGCTEDADCGSDGVCDCGDPANRCLTATCRIDADCPGSSLCIRTSYDDGCGRRVEYHCQTPDDACVQNADCPGDEECAYSMNDARHVCQGINCAIGRPFLVRGTERLAQPRRTDAWAAPLDEVNVEALSSECSALLAERWTRIGLMEHASIAAFARFSLQLLAFGAPAELVSLSAAAMGDELEHARIAFGFARAYGGRPVGPGALSMEAALEETDLESVLANVVREGCCGESIAAYEAEIAAAGAEDPPVRAALTRIAADERRHAGLAWQFVRWVLARHPELTHSALEAARRELEIARADRDAHSDVEDDGWLARYGIVPDAERRALRLDVLTTLTMPCLRAIGASARVAASSDATPAVLS